MSLAREKGNPAGPVSGDSLHALEAAIAVRTAVGRLPRNQGKTVLMRVVHGLSYQEIGDVLGCSADTARSHFSKGKARLRELLSGLSI